MMQVRIIRNTVVLLGIALAGCETAATSPEVADAGSLPNPNPGPTPLNNATVEQKNVFARGDRLFEVPFRAADGLGPLYIRTSCESCHAADARGSGLVGKMVVVEADGWTTSADQSALPWGHTQRPFVTAGAMTPLEPPQGSPSVRFTLRLPPAVFGRGYMEAVDDKEIERMEAQAATRTDGIAGRINRLTYQSEFNPDSRFFSFEKGQSGLIGRFGLKGRVATLDDFTADAFSGDMGLSSPLRPNEPENPDGRKDDLKTGVDLSLAQINDVADYMRLLEIPPRRNQSEAGKTLFAQMKCSVCHAPSLRTRADYPIAALANIDAPVYTDFLLHDMGAALSDGFGGIDGQARSKEWKTAPLIGLRYFSSYLHDGRAKTVEQAVSMHAQPDSEARASLELFNALSPTDKSILLTFVQGL
jgi:CxxC motif-containing protein (DUF1111 family)